MDFVHYTERAFRTSSGYVREFLAETLGTFILVVFGCGALAQFVLNASSAQTTTSVNLAWGLALTMGIVVAGKISGGHLNPAVSIAMVTIGEMSFAHFLVYVAGQFLGAFLASSVVYMVYFSALNCFDGGFRQIGGSNGTAGIWATYPNPKVSTLNAFFDQFTGTALLVLMILSVTDKKNTNISHVFQALIIGLTVFIIATAFGSNAGGALNPARDLAPRLFTAMFGWGMGVFSAGNHFWWVPVVAPLLGAIFISFIYGFFIRNHWPNTIIVEQTVNETIETIEFQPTV